MFTPSRRNFLAAAGAVGLAGLAGAGLAGCATGTDTGTVPLGTGELVLPTYVADTKAKPDLPPIEPIGVTGYLKYPTERFATVTEKPLSGGAPISAIYPISAQPPVARESNLVWKNAEEHLGGALQLIQITESDYLQRFNTTIAGGDLPDLVFFQPIAGYDQLLTTTFEDLTPFLSGDAILAYPNLAAIPSAIWEATAKGGRLYGLPVPRNGMQGLGTYRADVVEAAGGYPENMDDYLALLREVTDPNKRMWGAIARAGAVYNLPQFLQLLGAPLNWRKESDGKLTHVVETPEFTQAVEIVAKLRADGVFHPESGAPNAKAKAAFDRGEALTTADTVTSLLGAVRDRTNPAFRPEAVVPFPGSQGVAWMDFLTKQMTCIRKAEKSRVEEILRLANYLAAPIGSDENLVLTYGKEGQTFDFVDGVPQVKKEYEAHASIGWGGITTGPMNFFNDRYPETVPPRYNGTKNLAPFLVKDPCANAYSTTDAEKGATLQQAIDDVCNDIISGRRPMAELAPAIDKWRSSGGDKMRDEYAADLA